jgi:hypothetical protein
VAKTRTGSGGVAVGELDYAVAVTVPTGTTGAALTLSETLNPGRLRGDGGRQVTAGLTCGGAACALPAPTVTNGGRTVTWALGHGDEPDPAGDPWLRRARGGGQRGGGGARLLERALPGWRRHLAERPRHGGRAGAGCSRRRPRCR